ncbi:MAG TPA: DUF6614 family protein [bacterium]|jgi:hypothetical protein
MNHFHIWCNLKAGQNVLQFCESVREFLSYLHERELIEGYYITRRKFVISPPLLGEFQITVDFASIAQMNRAFALLSEGGEEVLAFHKPLSDAVRNVSTALYRDFPEARRKKG